jgi:hypothetical protein
MIADVTWDTVAVWLLFAVAMVFLLKPMVPMFKRSKKSNKGDCNNCH